MGHNFGMSHDFDDKHCNNDKKVCVWKNDGSWWKKGEQCECQEWNKSDCVETTECVMGNGPDNCKCNGQGIMSYGDPPNKWSSCSVKDFLGYYKLNKWGETCLKGSAIFLLTYFSRDFMTTQYSVFRFT